MKYSIKEAQQTIYAQFLTNIASSNGQFLTPIVEGEHGVGKSQIAKDLANVCNGYAKIIDGSTLKEGEITGMPFATPSDNGGLETRFAPHWVIKSIADLESNISKKLDPTSFLGSDVVFSQGMDAASMTEAQQKMIKDITMIQNILCTDKLGAELYALLKAANGSQRLDIFTKTKDLIKPVFILLDEINRCERAVSQELMNFILSREINGFTLPWFVQLIGAINPADGDYSANSMDPAQLDRFSLIPVQATIEEWIPWARDNKIHMHVIEYLASNPKSFKMTDDEKKQGKQEVSVSPRSWSLVSSILHSFDNQTVNERIAAELNRVATGSERDTTMKGLMEITIKSKIGDLHGRQFIDYINDSSKFIDVKSLFKLEELKEHKGLSDVNKKKLRSQNDLRQSVFVSAFIEQYAIEAQAIVDNKSDTYAKYLDELFKDVYTALTQMNKLQLATSTTRVKMCDATGKETQAIAFTFCINPKNAQPATTKIILNAVQDKKSVDSDIMNS